MPVAREPAKVCRGNWPRPSGPLEDPANLLTGSLGNGDVVGISRLDPVIRPHVDHHARAIGQPGEEVRRVPTALAILPPGQAERQRGERHHLGIEVQRYGDVPLQPRLEPHVGVHRGRVVQASKVLLAAERRKRSHRSRALKRLSPHLA